MIPSDFPKWREPAQNGMSVLGLALKNQVGEARRKQGRNASMSFIIVGAQSVKNSNSTEQKGYNADKKVPGIKCHIAVDMLGLPHAITVTAAEVANSTWAIEAMTRCAANLTHVTSILVDGVFQPTVCHCRQRQTDGHSSSLQAQRTPHHWGHSATLDH